MRPQGPVAFFPERRYGSRNTGKSSGDGGTSGDSAPVDRVLVATELRDNFIKDTNGPLGGLPLMGGVEFCGIDDAPDNLLYVAFAGLKGAGNRGIVTLYPVKKR